MSDSDELRRLRSRVATLETDKRVLEERLAFAWQEVNRIRAKLLDARSSRLQTAPPGTRRVEVETVTPRELGAALALLTRVRSMSLCRCIASPCT
jgi:hypothetical protein